jgi:hypothetical protein
VELELYILKMENHNTKDNGEMICIMDGVPYILRMPHGLNMKVNLKMESSKVEEEYILEMARSMMENSEEIKFQEEVEK